MGTLYFGGTVVQKGKEERMRKVENQGSVKSQRPLGFGVEEYGEKALHCQTLH